MPLSTERIHPMTHSNHMENGQHQSMMNGDTITTTTQGAYQRAVPNTGKTRRAGRRQRAKQDAGLTAIPTQFSKKYIRQNVQKWKAEVQANPISEYGPPPSASANGMVSGILKWNR